jgi:hypothetical protein
MLWQPIEQVQKRPSWGSGDKAAERQRFVALLLVYPR